MSKQLYLRTYVLLLLIVRSVIPVRETCVKLLVDILLMNLTYCIQSSYASAVVAFTTSTQSINKHTDDDDNSCLISSAYIITLFS